MEALRRRGVPPTSKGSSRRHSAVFACDTGRTTRTSIDPNPQLRRQHDAYARTTQLRTRRQLENYRDFSLLVFANILERALLAVALLRRGLQPRGRRRNKPRSRREEGS